MPESAFLPHIALECPIFGALMMEVVLVAPVDRHASGWRAVPAP